MINIVRALVLGALLGLVGSVLIDVLARAQSSQSYVIMQPSSGYLPPTIIIRSETPAQVQVCAEGAGGSLAACRSVAEFREWASQRASFQFKK